MVVAAYAPTPAASGVFSGSDALAAANRIANNGPARTVSLDSPPALRDVSPPSPYGALVPSPYGDLDAVARRSGGAAVADGGTAPIEPPPRSGSPPKRKGAR